MRTNDEMLAELMDDATAPVAVYRGSALRDLAAAVESRTRADSAVLAAVLAAREDGATWQMIGDILGMTKQGAAKRFAA